MSLQGPKTNQSRQPTALEQTIVHSAFDPDVLKHICETWDFTDYATKHQLGADPDRFYWYQDNGSDILAVAHLDTVQNDRTCQVIDTAAGPLAVSGALDDRLGAYVILELLPTLGVTCDILLTTDEECAQSTAREFAEDFQGGKQYNWIIQFDRGGTDVVMYQYETPTYAELVEASGAVVGMGSYSDIAELDDLGCAAFNWGVGYQDYHSPKSHAWLSDTFRSVARFLRFHSANASRHLVHEDYHQESMDDDWLNYRDMDREDLDWMKSVPPASEVEADCGHDVDLADDKTYCEWINGDYIICADCETRLSS